MTPDEALVAVLGTSDLAFASHHDRVAAHAETIATAIGWGGEQLPAVRLGAALHDVGKARIRAAVLDKPGRLAPDELEEVRMHPVEGAWLVAQVPSLVPVLPYVLFHHERWDGGGYPTRRAGAQIPLEGRIMAVADAFDAMTSDRPYRAALTLEQAVGELRRGAGTQFDPELATVFAEAVEIDAALAA